MSEIRLINKELGEIKINNKGYFAIPDDIYNAIEQLQQENEKQQLISFLEDKIKKCNSKTIIISEEFCYWTAREKSYQEVLDFVEKGGKDE